jgi:hypothetical protein
VNEPKRLDTGTLTTYGLPASVQVTDPVLGKLVVSITVAADAAVGKIKTASTMLAVTSVVCERTHLRERPFILPPV